MTSRSSPSTLMVLLPLYGPNTTLSPTFTASGRTSPLSRTLPVPTATTSPWFGFSAAEPGSTMPPAVLVSSSLRRITTRSCRGRSFIVDLSLEVVATADACIGGLVNTGAAGGDERHPSPESALPGDQPPGGDSSMRAGQ